jgi:hypothetical protein
MRNPGELAETLRHKIVARSQHRRPELDRRSLEIALETRAEERAGYSAISASPASTKRLWIAS